MRDTETHCHCGTAYGGSDHCPECGCEQYESYACAAGETQAWLDEAQALRDKAYMALIEAEDELRQARNAAINAGYPYE